MVSTIVVGGFFGDEGKGKIVAHIAYTEHPSIIARGGVGPNAGHTVIKDGVKYGVRMVPSGFIYDKARLLIGAGVLVDPVVLDREVKQLGCGGRIGVDYRCSIIEEKHIAEDRGTERLAKKIGTTGTGCGPANKERVMRSAKQAKDVEPLEKYLTDVAQECNDAIKRRREPHHRRLPGLWYFSLLWHLSLRDVEGYLRVLPCGGRGRRPHEDRRGGRRL